jgi:hypothetical protein
MKEIRSSVLVLAAFAVTVGLLTAAAAAPVPPEKKCYNADHEEIPCPNSNYYQTRDAVRHAEPTSARVLPANTMPPVAPPTAWPTIAATWTASPAPSATPAQLALPATASSPLETPSQPSALQVMIPLLMLGCAGLVGIIVLVILFRWLSSRRSAPPGPPTAQ